MTKAEEKTEMFNSIFASVFNSKISGSLRLFGKNSFLRRLSGTGTACSGKRLSHHPWRCVKHV